MELLVLLCEQGKHNGYGWRTKVKENKVRERSMRLGSFAHFQWVACGDIDLFMFGKYDEAMPEIVCEWKVGKFVNGVRVEAEKMQKGNFQVIFSSSDAAARFGRSPDVNAKVTVSLRTFKGLKKSKGGYLRLARRLSLKIVKCVSCLWKVELLCQVAYSRSRGLRKSSRCRNLSQRKWREFSSEWRESEPSRNDNNKSRIFPCDSTAESVCVWRGKKKAIGKEYPTASRQIDFSQVLSAFRISCT